MNIPFHRTECGCKDCVACCTRQPGHLLPGQLEAVAEHLGATVEEVLPLFRASQGALVADTSTGRVFRIRTITPATVRRRCVFLDEANRCRIHPVAPFGCSHFDSHMTAAEGQRRSVWGMTLIRDDAAYHALRDRLKFADSYKPTGY